MSHTKKKVSTITFGGCGVFRENNEKILKNPVFAKSFVCYQRLHEKHDGRQKRAARGKSPKLDFWSNRFYLRFNFLSMVFRYQTKHVGLLRIA